MAKKVAKKRVSAKTSKPAAKTAKTKLIYLFGAKTDGDATMRNLLGGKGANLAEMARIGLPVPPGFTITTEVCDFFYKNGRKYPAALAADVRAGVGSVEKQMGKIFGDEKDPLLFSVRSGARESMPGMMDTILNLGLNDKTVEGLAAKTGNARFAWDCYRRFIQMYGDVVMGVQARTEAESEPFDEVMGELKAKVGAKLDTDLGVDDLRELVKRYKALIKSRTGKAFPQDVYEQLWGAVGAVFNSWMNERAIIYRQKYNIPASWGTAVNVQTMVFGNKGETSATGVAFTRDPANGENVFYGEYLSTRRARTSSRACARRIKSRCSRRKCPRHTRSFWQSARSSSGTSRICRTSSSQSRKTNSLCSRPATANARGFRQSESRSK